MKEMTIIEKIIAPTPKRENAIKQMAKNAEKIAMSDKRPT
jgi:hypothetical protein